MDHGFLYGDGVFETLRLYEGRPFLFGAHLDRLYAGLSALGITGAPSQAVLRARLVETQRHAGLDDAYVRITVTRGVGTRGLDPSGCSEPTVMVAVLPLRPYPDTHYTHGISGTFLWERSVADLPPPTVKSTSYQRGVLARAELGRRGAQEGFYVDASGHVLEGVVSNVFAVTPEGTLLTPPPDVCLPGITRAEVLRLAKSLGIYTDEAPLPRQRLLDAEELFVTSSLSELLPVISIDGRPIGAGAPGRLTRRLHEMYRDRTRSAPAEESSS